MLGPVSGKNIVTLQTCTLPDYTNRLLVRGELQGISEAWRPVDTTDAPEEGRGLLAPALWLYYSNREKVQTKEMGN